MKKILSQEAPPSKRAILKKVRKNWFKTRVIIQSVLFPLSTIRVCDKFLDLRFAPVDAHVYLGVLNFYSVPSEHLLVHADEETPFHTFGTIPIS